MLSSIFNHDTKWLANDAASTTSLVTKRIKTGLRRREDLDPDQALFRAADRSQARCHTATQKA